MSNPVIQTSPEMPLSVQTLPNPEDPIPKLVQLSSRLDNLLAVYLDQLDKYTKLRAELSQSFSSGFLSLAHANRVSTTGRRYGEEGYDQRMKATRKVSIDNFTESEAPINVPNEQSEVKKDSKETSNTERKVESHDYIPHNQYNFAIVKEIKSSEPTTNSNDKVKSKPFSSDPLKWFGILTPQSLRETQTQFIQVVEKLVPNLLNTTNTMNGLEIEIEGLRKELELEEKRVTMEETTLYQTDEEPEDAKADDDAHLQIDDESKESNDEVESSIGMRKLGSPSQASALSSSRPHILVSRPAEPRSRLLKMD